MHNLPGVIVVLKGAPKSVKLSNKYHRILDDERSSTSGLDTVGAFGKQRGHASGTFCNIFKLASREGTAIGDGLVVDQSVGDKEGRKDKTDISLSFFLSVSCFPRLQLFGGFPLQSRSS